MPGTDPSPAPAGGSQRDAGGSQREAADRGPGVEGEPGAAGGPTAATLLERGSFAHATCAVCGWLGPARRSRRTARNDAASHGAGCPGPVVAS